MTAKEIAKKYASSIGAKGYGSARFDLSVECEKEIIDYAKQKCKSQRIICARYIANNSLKDSPTPWFE